MARGSEPPIARTIACTLAHIPMPAVPCPAPTSAWRDTHIRANPFGGRCRFRPLLHQRNAVRKDGGAGHSRAVADGLRQRLPGSGDSVQTDRQWE